MFHREGGVPWDYRPPKLKFPPQDLFTLPFVLLSYLTSHQVPCLLLSEIISWGCLFNKPCSDFCKAAFWAWRCLSSPEEAPSVEITPPSDVLSPTRLFSLSRSEVNFSFSSQTFQSVCTCYMYSNTLVKCWSTNKQYHPYPSELPNNLQKLHF